VRKKFLFFIQVRIKKTKQMSSKASSTKTTKTTKKVVKEVVPEPEVVVETTVEATVEPTVETTVEATVEATVEVETKSLKTRFEELVKLTQEHISGLKVVSTELRKLQRDHEAAVKEASKKSKRKQPKDGSVRKASGFASPVIVSDEMYAFLAPFGVEQGSPIARTDVTRHITAYIRDNNLQNPEYRREIVPNAALKKLLGPAEELKDAADPNSKKVYTYLRLQKYLSKHFPSKKVATA
jgi:chromatin remodeling complex protein RSC6